MSNNEYLKESTVSNKIKKIELIEEYVTRRIDESQSIKRLLVYNTRTPLSERGAGYDSSIVNQPDIDKSLVDENIIACIFNPEIENIVNNKIYIGVVGSGYNSNRNSFGNINFDVNILVSQQYDKISSGKRKYKIADEIANLLDGISVDKGDVDFYNGLGDVKFNLNRTFLTRLSKTNKLLWLRLEFSVDILGWRTHESYL